MSERHVIIVLKPFMLVPEYVEHEPGLVEYEAIKEALSDGWLETVPETPRTVHLVAFCDEDGLQKNLPYNVLASSMFDRSLVGVVVINRHASREEDPAGTYTFEESYARSLMKALGVD